MKKIKVLALLAALLTALGVFFFARSLGRPAAEPEQQVIVAAADIAENTVVRPDMVKKASLPVRAVLPQSVKDESLVVGKMLNVGVVSGQQILSGQLASTGSVGGRTLAYSVKPGMRAVTVGVDSITGLDGMIQPGDTIDLVAQLKNPQGASSAVTPASVLLLQGITVLATDQNMTGKTVSGGTAAYKTLTLQVTPEQAVKLCYIEDNASLRAILRSPLDHAQTTVPPITSGNLK